MDRTREGVGVLTEEQRHDRLSELADLLAAAPVSRRERRARERAARAAARARTRAVYQATGTVR